MKLLLSNSKTKMIFLHNKFKKSTNLYSFPFKVFVSNMLINRSDQKNIFVTDFV